MGCIIHKIIMLYAFKITRFSNLMRGKVPYQMLSNGRLSMKDNGLDFQKNNKIVKAFPKSRLGDNALQTFNL